MKCVILGAVTGGIENSKEIFEAYKNILQAKADIIGTPLDTAVFKGTHRERFERAEAMIREADLVIADLSSISTGAGIELGIAHILGKKISVFAKRDSNVSGLAIGMLGDGSINYYENLDDLKNQLANYGV